MWRRVTRATVVLLVLAVLLPVEFGAEESTPIKHGGNWRGYVKQDPMDDSKHALISLPADKGEGAVIGISCESSDKPLGIRIAVAWGKQLEKNCSVNHEIILFKSEESQFDGVTMETRLGTAKASTACWYLAENGETLVYPHRHSWKATTYIQEIVSARSLVARVNSNREDEMTAIFDTQGLDEARKLLQSACPAELWSPSGP